MTKCHSISFCGEFMNRNFQPHMSYAHRKQNIFSEECCLIYSGNWILLTLLVFFCFGFFFFFLVNIEMCAFNVILASLCCEAFKFSCWWSCPNHQNCGLFCVGLRANRVLNLRSKPQHYVRIIRFFHNSLIFTL